MKALTFFLSLIHIFPTDYNPVGAYVREFTVPAHWKGMDIFLDFEVVESAFYCWVNGELAGYSEDSRLPSHFNITPVSYTHLEDKNSFYPTPRTELNANDALK